MKTSKISIIKELEKLSEEVLNLKAEHRQKRPIVIAFSGSPKAGKTSCINSLELFLKRNGFSVKIIQERASVCPVSDKQSPMFNLWTACMSIAGLIGTLENKQNQVDILILDRGIFDALCWFQWLVDKCKMEKKQQEVAERFLLMEELIKTVDIVFAFSVIPSISIKREYANLLTDKPGTIMNESVLGEYLLAIESIVDTKKKFFHEIFRIDTSQKDQNEVGKEVTKITLETLKYRLMERIGYFESSDELKEVLSNKNFFTHDELGEFLHDIKFDLRDNVEKSDDFIQPIPIAVITNKERTKILVVKKSKQSVSKSSPEKDRLLIYIGGHSRYEDSTEINSNDMLSICRNTLRRELKEELGISIALDNIVPQYVYATNHKISAKHLAICFIVAVDEKNLKLHMDSHELVLNKGKSKSGRFLSFYEINKEAQLESWSMLILQNCFKMESEYNSSLNLFDDPK